MLPSSCAPAKSLTGKPCTQFLHLPARRKNPLDHLLQATHALYPPFNLLECSAVIDLRSPGRWPGIWFASFEACRAAPPRRPAHASVPRAPCSLVYQALILLMSNLLQSIISCLSRFASRRLERDH